MSKNIKDIKNFIVDLDGTTYISGKEIPGSRDFFDTLKKQKKNYVFLTNNSSANAKIYQEKLAKIGIDVDEEQIFTSGMATVIFLKKHKDYNKIFPLGTPSFEIELEKAGLVIDDDNPDCVVLSFDKTLTYEKLEKACLFIRKGVPFIATHPDIVCPTEYGYIPDCGAMIALIESATGVSPKIIGKPKKEMLKAIMDKTNFSSNETAIVGDRIYTDIRMGKDAGIIAILVLSGETKKRDLKDSKILPDFVFKSLKELKNELE